MPFKKSTVEFSRTSALPKITDDYIHAVANLSPFVAAFPEIDSFQKIITTRKSSPVNRSLLVTVLKEQNAASSMSVLQNIDLLQNENTLTITTGHQLNILTGPLYFIYKIVTTIKLALILKEKYSAFNFVPVYWMNGEDHDIEEINHTYLLGKKVEWNTDQKGATGRMNCSGMAAVLNEVEGIIGSNESTAKILSILRNAYKETNTLSEATRILVNSLFEKYGLVILDADDKRLKKEFAHIIKDDLINHSAFNKVNETIAELKNKYEAQVHPREINLFYLDGLRERIGKEDGKWKVLNTHMEWTEEELIKELSNHPERFSPNVVLRPLYQELLLPNVAMVGGPAEVAYWMEYKRMFEHYRISFPMLIVRQCTMIVEDVFAKRVSKLGFAEEQLFNSMDALIKDYIRKYSLDFSNTEEVIQIKESLDKLVLKVSQLDPSLIQAAEAEKQRQLNSLKGFEEKIIRAEKKKHETAIQQIQKLKDKLFPEGVLQERHDNFIPLFVKYGESLFDELLANANPPEKNFMVLTETQ